MRLRNYIEPFVELILSKATLKFRLMRFFGRIPFIRNHGFDSSYEQTLNEVKFIDMRSDVPPLEIINRLRSVGVSTGINLTQSFLKYLENRVRIGKFIDRVDKSGSFELDPYNLNNPGNGYLYSLMNVHKDDERIGKFVLDEVKPVADAYIGADAQLINTQIWATFPDGRVDYNPDFGFHYDLDDYRFLKFFIYLTDVDENCGPHEVVLGSHRGNKLFRFFNRRLDDHLPCKFLPRIKTIIGKKGEGFFEDTLCYHRGIRPNKARLIFQVQFALDSPDN